MTRSERLTKLRELRASNPATDMLYLEILFIPWQGQVSALLSYNRKLQQDFQAAVGAIQAAPDTSSPSYKQASPNPTPGHSSTQPRTTPSPDLDIHFPKPHL